MGISRLLVCTTLVAAGVPGISLAIELQPETVTAWDNYIHRAGLRIQRLNANRPFLWIDESPERRARLERGEVLIAPVVGRGTETVPNGLIHDWIGAAFIANTTVATLLAVLHDYDRYKDVYKPVVMDSRVLACSGMAHEFSMSWQRRVLFVNAAMEGQYRSQDFAIDPRRGYMVAETTRLQEIQDYGRPTEHLMPPDKGSGFIWRLHSIAAYEERDGGVYLELEVIALTRDIPASLRWMVHPVVNHLSISSLTTTLRQTREAVNRTPAQPGMLATCRGNTREFAIARPLGK